MTNVRPNFGFGFGFGAERVYFNTFGILSDSAESSRDTFGNISASAAVTPNFGGHRKQVRSSDTVSTAPRSNYPSTLMTTAELQEPTVCRQAKQPAGRERRKKLLFLSYNLRLLDLATDLTHTRVCTLRYQTFYLRDMNALLCWLNCRPTTSSETLYKWYYICWTACQTCMPSYCFLRRRWLEAWL